MSAEASKWAIIGPEVKSWVPYDASTDFPIQNLPYGVFSRVGGDGAAHIGVAIGDQVLDLFELANQGFFVKAQHLRNGACFKQPVLNEFMSLGRPAWKEARTIIASLLTEGNTALKDSPVRAHALVPLAAVKMHMPANIGDYTDFYSSRSHATNVGIMFRGKDNALQPNWLHLPVGYHGRSSSVVVSGTDLLRPRGQLAPDEKTPSFGACKTLDFELEMAYFLGPGNELGHPIKIAEAGDHVFGAVLMNDWSARDIQKWEYVPLGPFGAKNFGTTISPWVVTTDALQPFRTEAEPQVNPPILPYLQDPDHHVHDIKLEVALTTAKQVEPFVISRSNAKHLYWSYKQQLVHHSITGCNMRPADLIGSGTISGPEEGSFGSLLEISWKGTKEINLPSGEVRKFLQDGDSILIRGWCEGAGYRVGFGPCDGRILPALPLEEI